MRRVAVIIVAGSLTALPVPASAVRLLGGTVGFDGNFDVVYDTNVLRLPSGSTRRPGTSRSDIRYEPSAAATYTRALGRQSIVLSGLYGRDIYQRNDYLSRDRLALNAALNYAVGARCKGVLSAALSQRQSGNYGFGIADPTVFDPDLDPGIDDDSGRRIDNRQDFTTYGLTANCGGDNGGLSFGGNVNRYELRNKAVTRRFADSDTTTVGGFVGLGILRPGQLQVVGSYSEITYPNGLVIPGVPVPFTRAALDSYRIGLNYSRPIGNRLSGSVGASYLKGVPRGSGGQGYSSPAYNFALTYTPGTRLTTTLSGSRDIVASSGAGALYKVVDDVSLVATYRASPSISARARGSYQRRDFRQPFATADDVLPRGKEDFIVVGGGVSYAPRKLYDISFDVAQSFRNSTPSIFDYKNTSATISLSVHL